MAEIGDEDASPARGERLRIAKGLRAEEEPEAHRRAGVVGNLEIVIRLVDELDEQTPPRVSLVKLAGRVEEAWAIAERGGAVRRIAKSPPQGGEGLSNLRARMEVGEDRDGADGRSP
jgi:hypothetical protein